MALSREEAAALRAERVRMLERFGELVARANREGANLPPFDPVEEQIELPLDGVDGMGRMFDKVFK